MLRTIPIVDFADARVSDYRAVKHPELASAGGYFIAEGRYVVERLIANTALQVRSLLLSRPALAALHDPLTSLPPQTPIYVVDSSLFESITGFDIHRGCLAVAKRPPVMSLAALIGPARLLVVVEDCANADNLGGIFRNAEAFAADGVVLSPSSGDPFYRKAIRTSMAASFRVPFTRAQEWPEALDILKSAGFTIVAMTPQQPAQALADFVASGMPQRLAVLVGAEGPGLTIDALRRADVRVRIPMANNVDSLNLAVATGIALSRLSRAALSDTT